MKKYIKKIGITLMALLTMLSSSGDILLNVLAEENNTDVSETDNDSTTVESENTQLKSSAGSVSIDSLSTELYSGATLDSTDDDGNKSYTWYAKSSDKGHEIAYRVNYSTSGEGELEVGEFHFTIPMNMIRDKSGAYADTYEMSLPTEDEFDEAYAEDDETFLAYKEQDSDGDGVNDQLYIYNAVEVSAALSGYVEIAYKLNNTSFEYVDGTELNDFSVELTERTVSKSSNTCSAKIDTNASITNAYFDSSEQRRYSSWQTEWGTDAKPENDSDYYYTLWNVVLTLGDEVTQKYKLVLDSVLDGTKGNVTAVGYRVGGGTFSPNNYVENCTLSKSVYATIITAYPKSEYSSLTTMQQTHDLTVTVIPNDGLKETTTATTSRTFKWQQPEFTAPTGKGFSINVHGNGGYREDDNGSTYWQEGTSRHYSAFDGGRGQFYENFQLKDFQDGKVSEIEDLTFYEHAYNWYPSETLKEDGDKDNPDDYFQKKVTKNIVSGELYLEDVTEDDILDDDYEFKSTALTSDDYYITYIDWTAYNKQYTLDEDTQSFVGKDYKSEELYYFYVKTAGSDEWKEVATYLPSEDRYTITDASVVSSVSKNKVVFNDDANVYEYKIETTNSYGYTEICARTHINLKDSETVKNYCKNKEVAYLYMQSYQNMDDDGEYWDKSYDFDRIVPLQKNTSFYKQVVGSENQSKKKQYVITWKVALSETVSKGSGEVSNIVQNGGTFYDLLPKGSTLDKDSVYVTDESGNVLGDGSYTIITTKNYKNSGRILLTVKVTKAAKAYNLYYDTVHSWESMKDYGTSELNPVAYETGNDEITGGYYDDPTKPENEDQAYGLEESDRKWFTDLSDGDDTKARFVYADSTKDILAITSATTGLTKKVLAGEDSNYSTSETTNINATYSYRLRYQNTYVNKASDIILYDSLENYTPSGKASAWHGTVQCVDVSQLTSKGIDAKVYYSTIENLDVESNHDLTDSSVWTLSDENTDWSTAKAIAIDASKTTDGTDYTLAAGSSISAIIYMTAPSESPETSGNYPEAYNNVYMSSTFSSGESSIDYFIHQDYTKIALAVTGNVSLQKVNVNNTDEKLSGLQFRLYGTSDYGTSVDSILTTNTNGEITFVNIEKGTYTLSEYDATEDYQLDFTPHTVVIDEKGNVFIDGTDYTNSEITLTNKPRIHADITFSKKVLGGTSVISGAQFKLSGTSDYGNNILKYATSSITGKVTFENVEKGSYTVVETKAPAGYVLDSNNKYNVLVDENGQVSWTIATGDEETLDTTGKTPAIYNEEKHSVGIYKVNSYDYSAVSGVTFELVGTSDAGNKFDLHATTSDSGIAAFGGLESGTYVLKETEVSDDSGVKLDTTAKILTIDKYGNSSIEGVEKDSLGNFIIVDAAKASKQVTVIKKWKDSSTTDHSNDLPNIHIEATASPDTTSQETGATNSESITSKISNVVSSAFNLTTVNAEESTFDINDWTYKIDDYGNLVLLNYVGTATDMCLPTTATVNGTTYPVTLFYKGDSFNSYSLVLYQLHDFGTIENLSFESGFNLNNKYSKTLLKDEETVNIFAKTNLKTIDVSNFDTSRIVRLSNFFTNSQKLTSITGLENWDVSNVTNMSGLFNKLLSLTSLEGIANWNTSNLTEMSNLFTYSAKIESIDLSGWNLSKVQTMSALCTTNGGLKSIRFNPNTSTDSLTNMWAMFSGCTGLTGTLDLSMFNTSKVTNMEYLFAGNNVSYIKGIDTWDTSSCTNMGYMFNNCNSLKELDVSNFKTSKVKAMTYMFNGCNLLTTIDVSGFDTSSCTNMAGMFRDCKALTSVNVNSFNTSKVTSMNGMFSNDGELTELDLSNFDTAKVTNMGYMFNSCQKLTKLDVSSFDVSSVTDLSYMFSNCRILTTLDTSGFKTNSATNMTYMFNCCNALTDIDLSGFKTDKVTNTSYMFNGCKKFTNLDAVSSWNVSLVTNMESMFYECQNIKSLDLSSWNPGKVTNFGYMFRYCMNLEALNLSGWDTSSATTMAYMFNNCYKLKSLDVSSFNTEKVTDMSFMFSSCKKLESVNVSSFNTSKVTVMNRMFDQCNTLTELDLSCFDVSKVTNTLGMLDGCNSLTRFVAFENKATTTSASNSIWYKSSNNSKLVNENNSVYTLVGNISAIKLKKGDIISSATEKIYSNAKGDGYTGNWTALSEYNHKHGEKLTADVTVNGSSYVSLNASYASITDAEWEANPDGIWFVWEKEGQSADSQAYDSTSDFYTPTYDEDGNITSTPEETYPDDGYWTKIDDSTYAYTFYVYDSSVAWKIWEDEVEGYTGDATSSNPLVIASGDETAVITNTADEVVNQTYGNIDITSIVNDPNGVHVEKAFSYTVTLTDSDGNALTGTTIYGDVPFKDGVAKVTIEDGGMVTIPNVPVGYHYTVTMDENAYTTKTTTYTNEVGSAPENDTAHAVIETSFPEQSEEVKYGRFIITNTVAGNDKDSYTGQEFNYVATLDGLEAGQTYMLYSDEDRTTTYVTFQADKEGSATVNLVIKDGEKVYSQDLPENATYVIMQQAATDFVTSFDAKSTNGTVTSSHKENTVSGTELTTDKETNEADEVAQFDFLNTTAVTKDLHLTKKVDGSADANAEYEFKIELSGLKANQVLTSNSYGRFVADENGTVSKTINLKADGEFILYNVPSGASYKITETADTKFEASATLNSTDASLETDSSGNSYLKSSIAKTDADTEDIVWTNKMVKTYSITYKKLVDGSLGNKYKEFEFEVQFDKDTRANTVITAHDSLTDKDVAIAIDKNGVAKFTLHSGKAVTFSGLTESEIQSMSDGATSTADVCKTTIGASEKDYSSDGYTTTSVTDFDEDNDSYSVTYTNTKNSGVPTGQHMSSAMIPLGTGLLLSIAYFLMKKKRGTIE